MTLLATRIVASRHTIQLAWPGVVALMTLLFAGCIAPFYTPVTDQRVVAQAFSPLYCQKNVDCVLKWHRAVNFVSEHSGYPLKRLSPEFAETYGPDEGRPGIATVIRQQALGNGKYQIVIDLYCGANLNDIISCGRKNQLLRYETAFKQAVNGSATSSAVPGVPAPITIYNEQANDGLAIEHLPEITAVNIGPSASKLPGAVIVPAPAVLSPFPGSVHTDNVQPRRNRPLAEGDILELLTGGVYSSRIAVLVDERGITFRPTMQYLESLRRAGANQVLQRAVMTAHQIAHLRE